MGLMRRSRVVPIARGISEVLSGPGVKITEVTAVTWLSVSPRLLQSFFFPQPPVPSVCERAPAPAPAPAPARVRCVPVHGDVVGDSADRCVMTAYHCRCARVRVAGGPFWHVFSPRLHLCLRHVELGLTKERQGGEVGVGRRGGGGWPVLAHWAGLHSAREPVCVCVTWCLFHPAVDGYRKQVSYIMWGGASTLSFFFFLKNYLFLKHWKIKCFLWALVLLHFLMIYLILYFYTNFSTHWSLCEDMCIISDLSVVHKVL